MSKINRQGHVFTNGQFAGNLTEFTQDKSTNSYSFEYDETYIDKRQPPIGYHFPLRSAPYLRDDLHPFFTNLVSEGWVRVHQAAKSRLDKRDDFGLLLANGGDLIGAITVKPANKDATR